MRVWSSITFDLTNEVRPGMFTVLAEDSTVYHGPIAELKGQGTAQKQLDQQNQLVQQQLNQQQQLRNQMFGDANKAGSIASYLSGNVGFNPQAFSAMQSQFLNNNTANFNSARNQIMSALASRGAGGGDIPVGGDFSRSLSSLYGAQAGSQAQGLLGLNVENAQQALANQMNAANLYSGQTAQVGNNIGTFNQGANSSLNSYINAANAPGFMQAFGGALGKGLGAAAVGGIGASLGGLQSVMQGGSFGSGFGNPFTGGGKG